MDNEEKSKIFAKISDNGFYESSLNLKKFAHLLNCGVIFIIN